MPLPSFPFVVFDAFGTLLKIPSPARPYAQLREALATHGAPVDGFMRAVMTSRLGLAATAEQFGVDLPLPLLARFEDALGRELERIVPYPEAERVVASVLGQGATVVVASNLAWPYGASVLAFLRRFGAVGPFARLQTAFSYDLGRLKPEAEFYQAVAHQLRLGDVPASDLASRIAMIGDRHDEDVAAPHRAGWSAQRLVRSRDETLDDAWRRLIETQVV